MKLTYRGISYDYTPPQVEMKEGQLAGRYRGLDWRFCNPTKTYVQPPTLELRYRGVAYATDANEAQPATVTTSATPQLDVMERARDLIMGHQQSIKKRQQSMLTRLAVEVGLPARDASLYWNRIQGKVHPTFRATYDRKTVAMS